jgi:hypothetical protein
LNPRTLGPMASTLTITAPKTTGVIIVWGCLTEGSRG